MLPSLLGHNTAIPQHLKPTQQAHLKALHQQTIFSPNDDERKGAKMNSPDDLAIGSCCKSDHRLRPASCRTEPTPPPRGSRCRFRARARSARGKQVAAPASPARGSAVIVADLAAASDDHQQLRTGCWMRHHFRLEPAEKEPASGSRSCSRGGNRRPRCWSATKRATTWMLWPLLDATAVGQPGPRTPRQALDCSRRRAVVRRRQRRMRGGALQSP